MEQEKTKKPVIDLGILMEDILREARRLWLLALVLIVVFSAGLTAYRYVSYTPRYQASASFNVKVANPLQSSVNAYNMETAEQMANTFPYILTSGMLQSRVKEHLGMSWLPSISAEVLPNSNIFTLKVTDTEPQRAYDVLNAVIVCYPEVSDFVVGPTTMYLLNDSGVPTEPYNEMDLTQGMWQGAVIGFLIWALIILVQALLKTTIHNEDELKKLLNTECMGQLPVARIPGKAGCPLIGSKYDLQGFSEAVRLMRLRIEKKLQEANCQVLLVSSAIPGEGKTTVSANLACALAQGGKRTLLIDWDMRNPSVVKNMQLHQKVGLAEYLNGKLHIEELDMDSGIENLAVLTGGMPNRDIYQNKHVWKRAAFLLAQLRKQYAYIIVDTPPCSLLADAAELTDLADGALMVVRRDYASQEQILDGIQCLTEGRLAILGCVINGVGHSAGYGYGYGYDYGYGKK